MVYLIGQSLKQQYFAPAISKATCFCLGMYIGAIVLAFLLSFGTQRFWELQVNMLIQPKLAVDKCFFISLLSDADQKVQNFKIKSSDSVKFQSSEGISTSFQQREDLIRLSFIATESFNNLNLVIPVKYTVDDSIKFMINDLIVVTVPPPGNFTRITSEAIVALQQTEAVSTQTVREPQYMEDLKSQSVDNDYSFSDLLESRHVNRRFWIDTKTTFEHSGYLSSKTPTSETYIDIYLRVPLYQELIVVPSEFEILKQKYLIFIAFLIPFWLLARYIIAWAIKHNLFYTRRSRPDAMVKYKED